MSEKVVRWLIPALGYLLLAYSLVFAVREGSKLVLLHTSGVIFSEFDVKGDSVLVFGKVDTTDFIAPPFPLRMDTLAVIKDSTADVKRLRSYFGSVRAVGEVIPLVFTHNGQQYSTSVKTRLTLEKDFVQVLLLEALRFLLIFSFVGVGLWALYKRPDSGGVRVLALYCMSMTCFMIDAVHVVSSGYALFEIPWASFFNWITWALFLGMGAFWLNLQLLFPKPKKIMREHPLLAYTICYLPFLFSGILIQISLMTDGKPAQYTVIAPVIVALQIVAGFAVLARGYWRSEGLLEKRQTRLVLFGSGIGIFLMLALVIFANIFSQWFRHIMNPLIIINLVFLALLLSPITFVYAFGRYRLLEIEGRLKRGTRYVAVTALLLIAFLLLTYGIGQLFLHNLGISGSVPTFAVAMILALLFVTSQQKIRTSLERRFYPSRYRLRQMLQDFAQRMLSTPDKTMFWSQLENRLRKDLAIESVYPILRAENNGVFAVRDELVSPFHSDSGLILTVDQDRRPLLVDEAVASGRASLADAETIWLEQRRVALILPLVSHDRLVGVLGLGFKMEQDDYTSEELQILSSLASQVAMASENLRLLEENIDKRRMEQELQVARKIQEGFLPQVIPVTQGLQVAAHSRFCLEVAGDYFDVINHNSGETVLAVGDVSGKGAGAALIMANLQASLRTAVGFGLRLADIVARINDLIYRNTPPEQYITFFVGVYDPGQQRLTYVNAGHNPPVLVRKNGGAELLTTGGLILGGMPAMLYEQETITLSEGDMLLLYTDGVSEAMNSENEEFGDDRIRNLLETNRHLPPQGLLELLETTVVEFRGASLFEDDFTLLLAKVA
jgi:serine phosphatase RsbU (regulator of sigma subunit)